MAKRRFCIVSMAISELSMPIHFLPKVSAATRAVPEPAKQSRTAQHFSVELPVSSQDGYGFLPEPAPQALV